MYKHALNWLINCIYLYFMLCNDPLKPKYLKTTFHDIIMVILERVVMIFNLSYTHKKERQVVKCYTKKLNFA